MKIGVFDSGLGGLFILKSLVKKLPQYDYIYLGDTKHVPYGNRSQAEIYKFTRQAVDYLFRNNCQLIILACNTASAEALRKIQQEYLLRHYPNRRVLGVIIPTAEEVKNYKQVGVIATASTVASRTFLIELKKLDPKIQVKQVATPLLVPMIENGQMAQIPKILKKYLRPLKNSQALILGCTHYPIIKSLIQKELGNKVRIISQTEIVPTKLKNYLQRHPEINQKLSKNSQVNFLTTKITPAMQNLGSRWFGKQIKLKLIKY